MAEVNYCSDRVGWRAGEGEEEGGRNKPDSRTVIGTQKNQMGQTKLKINVCGFQYGRELSGRQRWRHSPVRTLGTGDALLFILLLCFHNHRVNCGWTQSVTDMLWFKEHLKKKKRRLDVLDVFCRISAWPAHDWELIILGRCIIWPLFINFLWVISDITSCHLVVHLPNCLTHSRSVFLTTLSYPPIQSESICSFCLLLYLIVLQLNPRHTDAAPVCLNIWQFFKRKAQKIIFFWSSMHLSTFLNEIKIIEWTKRKGIHNICFICQEWDAPCDVTHYSLNQLHFIYSFLLGELIFENNVIDFNFRHCLNPPISFGVLSCWTNSSAAQNIAALCLICRRRSRITAS